jgi:hypothetical protein
MLGRHWCLRQGCQIFLVGTYQNSNYIKYICQMSIIFIKWPSNMAIKYTYVFHFKAHQNYPNCDENSPSGNPGLRDKRKVSVSQILLRNPNWSISTWQCKSRESSYRCFPPGARFDTSLQMCKVRFSKDRSQTWKLHFFYQSFRPKTSIFYQYLPMFCLCCGSPCSAAAFSKVCHISR